METDFNLFKALYLDINNRNVLQETVPYITRKSRIVINRSIPSDGSYFECHNCFRSNFTCKEIMITRSHCGYLFCNECWMDHMSKCSELYDFFFSYDSGSCFVFDIIQSCDITGNSRIINRITVNSSYFSYYGVNTNNNIRFSPTNIRNVSYKETECLTYKEFLSLSELLENEDITKLPISVFFSTKTIREYLDKKTQQ